MGDADREVGIAINTSADSKALEDVNRQLDELNNKQRENSGVQNDNSDAQNANDEAAQQLRESIRTVADTTRIASQAIQGKTASLRDLVGVMRTAAMGLAGFGTSMLAAVGAAVALTVGAKNLGAKLGELSVNASDVKSEIDAMNERIKQKTDAKNSLISQIADEAKRAADELQRQVAGMEEVQNKEAAMRSAEAGKRIAEVDLRLSRGEISKAEADSQKAGIRSDASTVAATNALLTIEDQIKMLLHNGMTEDNPQIQNLRIDQRRAEFELDTVSLKNRATRQDERNTNEDSAIRRSASPGASFEVPFDEDAVTVDERVKRNQASVAPLARLPGGAIAGGDIGAAVQQHARELIQQMIEHAGNIDELIKALKDMGVIFKGNNATTRAELTQLKNDLDTVKSQLQHNGTR